MQSQTAAPRCAPADPNPRPPTRPLPALACDTHVHVCGPESRYTYSPERVYTPPDALLPDYLRVAGILGLERVVFVQPSVYGSDNRVMLQAMAQCPLASRGVAVLDERIADAGLEALHAAGVRGVRFNLVDVNEPSSGLPLPALIDFGKRIAALGWHLELLLHVDEYPNLDDQLSDVPVDVVLGHLGYVRSDRTPRDPGFQTLLRLLRSGRCWVKLTGPYRISAEEFPYTSMQGFAETLLAEAPERLLWGSDWPHVMMRKSMPNDGDLMNLFFDWAPDEAVARRVLVENPARLYGFEPGNN